VGGIPFWGRILFKTVFGAALFELRELEELPSPKGATTGDSASLKSNYLLVDMSETVLGVKP
jgi:hypothetical protein